MTSVQQQQALKIKKTRMWADAQRDSRLARKFRNSIPCTAPQSLADAPAGTPCSNAANIEGKTWTQSEFCTWQNSARGVRAPENVYVMYQPKRRPNIAKSLVGLR